MTHTPVPAEKNWLVRDVTYRKALYGSREPVAFAAGDCQGGEKFFSDGNACLKKFFLLAPEKKASLTAPGANATGQVRNHK